MTRLKLSDIADEKPVRLTIELPARLHRELLAYAAAMNGGAAAGAPTVESAIASRKRWRRLSSLFMMS